MNMRNNFSISVTEQRTVIPDMTRTLFSAPQVSEGHIMIVFVLVVSIAPVSVRVIYDFHFGETSESGKYNYVVHKGK